VALSLGAEWALSIMFKMPAAGLTLFSPLGYSTPQHTLNIKSAVLIKQIWMIAELFLIQDSGSYLKSSHK
jgi:predicted membrane protein